MFPELPVTPDQHIRIKLKGPVYTKCPELLGYPYLFISQAGTCTDDNANSRLALLKQVKAVLGVQLTISNPKLGN